MTFFLDRIPREVRYFYNIFMMKIFGILLCATSFLFAEPVGKAVKYHELLLKNADNETLMERFLNAWLDEQSREELEKWLEAEVESGGAAERRILARYLDHVGLDEKALKNYQLVLKEEPEDEKTMLAVAKLQAARLDFEGALKTLGNREDVEAVTLRGTYEHRLGNTKVALALWRGLLEKKAGDRELREDLVSLFREEGLGNEARELQEELIAMGKEPFQRALDQLDLGDLQLENGLKDAALASYREVLTVSGSGSWMEREALHKLSEIFRQERDAAGLRVFLAELREAMPHRLVLQKSFARQLVITGEVDEGVAAFREILRRTPGDESLRMEFVELLAFAEQDEEAAEELEVLIEKGATAERLIRLAELKKSFDEEQVMGTLRELEKLKSVDAAGLLEMARVYARFDLDEEALRVLKAGRGKYVDSREISEALAVLLVEEDREDEALAIWNEMAKKGGLEEALRVAASLRRHGLRREAFSLLGEHRQELEGTFAGLRLYCDLALEVGEVEPAWKALRKLLTLPEVFSDLQVAVNLGSAIGQKRGLVGAISELEGAKTENELCLLASLQQLAGRLPEADAVLAQAEGELAQRHRVGLLTRRGDFKGAITQLRGLIGERISLVQRRQLLDLLERRGDYEGALKEAEQWKISSPGEVLAWRKKASLLTKLGRRAEAANELRRARNVFGRDDVDLTRELAKMQLPLGKHREALRLYEHLFRTAKTDGARLGYLDEMYAAAREAGLDYEMISRYEKEHEKAKREVFPLRVLAQLYKHSRNSGARQEVLLKLHRLLPDDEKVLFELVALADENGDATGARQLLMDYAARTRSAAMLQRLASMQIKAGEVDAGLKILSEIAPDELKAEDLEAAALQLWQLGEHQLVLAFLEENETLVGADLRLRFLYSDFLAMVGRFEEAREIWVDLLGEEGALARSPSGAASRKVLAYRRPLVPPADRMRQWDWWRLIDVDFFRSLPQGSQSSMSSNYIPSDTHELRWLSLVRLAKVSSETDPSGDSWEVFIERLSYPWLNEVRGWGLRPKPESQSVKVDEVQKKEIEITPEIRLYNLIKNPESSREDFLKLAVEVVEEKPELATTCKLHALYKLPEGEEQLAALQEVVDLIVKEDVSSRNAQYLIRFIGPQLNVGLFPLFGKEHPSVQQQKMLKQLEPLWQSWVEKAEARDFDAINMGGSYFPLAVQRLSGDLAGYFKNLDRLLKAKVDVHRASNKVTRYSQPTRGLSDHHTLLNDLVSRHPIYALVFRADTSQLTPEALREKARELNWMPKGHEKLEEFAKEIPQVKDGLLRALLFSKVGLKDEFLAEMNELAEKGGLEEKLDAIALRQAPEIRGNNEESLRELLAIERAGLSPAELSLLDGVTLGEAQKNRQVQKLDEEMKDELSKILVQFTKGAGRSKASALSSLHRSLGLEMPQRRKQAGGARRQQHQSYRRLLSANGSGDSRREESEEERIERNFLTELKNGFSSNFEFGRVRGLVRKENYRGLKAKALALYEPGDSRSYLKRLRYAKLCLAYDDLELAHKLLKGLKEERPYDDDLDVLLLLALDGDQRAAELDEMSRAGSVAKVISLLRSLASVVEDEEAFFNTYERLVVLLEKRAAEFEQRDASAMLQIFQNFQKVSKAFEKRALHPMSSRLPKVKEGQDSKVGDWAVRTRQRKVILDAYGEMLRLRSVRDQVLRQLAKSMEELRLNEGNVEWMLFEALEKEPLTEVDWKSNPFAGSTHYRSRSGAQLSFQSLPLKAVLDSKKFSEESVDELVKHVFLSEKKGALVKAFLEGDASGVKKLLTEHQKEKEEKQKKLTQQALQKTKQVDSQQHWVTVLETLLRSARLEEPMGEILRKAMGDFVDQQELRRRDVLRICELGSLEDSLAALESFAADHFPATEFYDDYQELNKARLVPPEIERKISAGRSLFAALMNVPRAWIPLLTFLETSDQVVWLQLDEQKVRAGLQQRLDVKYKSVFYDRLRAEGFSEYDGLALLGAEKVSGSGGMSSWLESLILPLELSPTEGMTYWLKVSKDCHDQVESITYMEAFIAMRKDFQIDEEGRQKVLHRVLESELEKLFGLGEAHLKGLGNLVKRDFPKLEIPGASEELEALLERLRTIPAEGIEEWFEDLVTSDRKIKALSDDQAMGICTRLARGGGVEMAAEFWIAYLKTKKGGGRVVNGSSLNFGLLTRTPLEKALNLVDAIRFVRMVQEAFPDDPELVESMNYTRDMLEWREALSPFSSSRGKPAEALPFLDQMLKREGVTEIDKRILGGFLIKADLSGRSEKTSHQSFKMTLAESALAVHSPGIVETISALSQLQGRRKPEEDAKAMKALNAYLRDQRLEPEFRASLATSVMRKMERDEELLEWGDTAAVAMALRDLLARGCYGKTGSLPAAGAMMHFVNQDLASVSPELQRELYEAWVDSLKEGANKVLREKFGQNRSRRLFDVLFDFMDGGKRFPLPKQLLGEMVSSFSGDLDTMQRLVRTGNSKLVAELLPDPSRGFRSVFKSYSAVTQKLEKEVSAVLPADYQLLLKCHFSALRDEHDWKEETENAGYLQENRALAAAKLLAKKPPEEQAFRLRAIRYLNHSDEALKVVVPLFEDVLKDDLPLFARNHQGDFRYMLRWVKAGGAATVQSFVASKERFLRLSGMYVYYPELVELKTLLAPSLTAAEKMSLTCDIALLRDPRGAAEQKEEFLSRSDRVKKAAQYILENPLPEAQREVEKECITKLVRGGLAGAKSQELMQRDAKDLEKLDVAMLAGMSHEEIALLGYQLRASLAQGNVEAAMSCIRILADLEVELSKKERAQLINLILPKITLGLVAHAMRAEGRETVLVELKELSRSIFSETFSGRMNGEEPMQRAVLFLAFATHCLTDDKLGFEALIEGASDERRRRLLELKTIKSGGFAYESVVLVPLVTQPLYFDGQEFITEKFKPLRKSLFAKTREHSFADELSVALLMSKLRLSPADVDLGEEVMAAERGNIDAIVSAILTGDEALFLALLPTEAGQYFQAPSPSGERRQAESRSRTGRPGLSLPQLEEACRREGISKTLDLIEDDFQRLHFEVFLQSVMSSIYTRGVTYDLRKLDPEMEEEILNLLPDAGPARAQVLARLGKLIRPKSGLAKALIAQALTEDCGLRKSSETTQTIAEGDRLDTFFFGWVCALHAGDWAVLDRQFQLEVDETAFKVLSHCAGIQALYQVAGDASRAEDVLKRLSDYGVMKTDPASNAWFEVIGLVAGTKKSAFVNGFQDLGDAQKKQAQTEMAASLRSVLEVLTKVKIPKGQYFSSPHSWRLGVRQIWINSLVHEESAQVLKAIMDDDLRLFSTAGISAEERVRLMFQCFGWQALKGAIERSFEGELKTELLTELVLASRAQAESREAFEAFTESLASQVRPGSQAASKLWLKVASQRISKEDLEGAKAAREKIEASHLKDYELRNLRSQLERLKAK